jgi:hypothetical protein
MHQFITNAIVGIWQFASTSDIADTNAVEAAAAPGSGKRHRVTAVQINNTDTAVGTVVNIRSGTTVLASLFVGPFVAAAPGSAGSAATYPMPLIGSDNGNINVICVTTSAQARVSVQGYTELC